MSSLNNRKTVSCRKRGGGGRSTNPPQITTLSNDDISVHFPPRLSFYDLWYAQKVDIQWWNDGMHTFMLHFFTRHIYSLPITLFEKLTFVVAWLFKLYKKDVGKVFCAHIEKHINNQGLPYLWSRPGIFALALRKRTFMQCMNINNSVILLKGKSTKG